MSKSVESTRRELFEQLVSIPDSVTWSDETNSYIGQNFWLVDYAWQGFNAALDCVEIELPEAYYIEAGDGSGVYPTESIDGNWIAKDDTITSISNLNLGLKIK